MLVLTRGIGQSVVIDYAGQKLLVSVFEAKDGKVKLGFIGDTSIRVHRKEIWERIQTEKQKS